MEGAICERFARDSASRLLLKIQEDFRVSFAEREERRWGATKGCRFALNGLFCAGFGSKPTHNHFRRVHAEAYFHTRRFVG